MSYLDHTFALILAGGGGTRLWPKSRNKTPKQFLTLVGSETMMQISARRINQMIPWERIIVITNQLYKDEICNQLPNLPAENVIAEPDKRDTALAMLVGALFAKSKDPQAVVINCASDHVVTNGDEFVEVMKAASQTATENEYIVSVGVTPTRPATGFGYIECGNILDKINGRLPLYTVASFREKPDEETAKSFIATGKYYWNANMYVWSTNTLQASFEKYMPSLAQVTSTLETLNSTDFHAALPAIYEKADAISIDYAISEKADNLVLIPGDFGWNDVGDWKVVFDLATQNLEGNVVMGERPENAVTVDSENNLIHTNGKMIALVGIKDMIIIDTEEIMMIVPKDSSQDVKKIVEKLKKDGKKEYL